MQQSTKYILQVSLVYLSILLIMYLTPVFPVVMVSAFMLLILVVPAVLLVNLWFYDEDDNEY